MPIFLASERTHRFQRPGPRCLPKCSIYSSRIGRCRSLLHMDCSATLTALLRTSHITFGCEPVSAASTQEIMHLQLTYTLITEDHCLPLLWKDNIWTLITQVTIQVIKHKLLLRVTNLYTLEVREAPW